MLTLQMWINHELFTKYVLFCIILVYIVAILIFVSLQWDFRYPSCIKLQFKMTQWIKLRAQHRNYTNKIAI